MRAAPDPTRPVIVDVMLEVRQPTGETRLFPIVDGRIAQKAMEDRAADYVLAVDVLGGRPVGPEDWFACAGQTARICWTLTTGRDVHEILSNMFLLETWEYESGTVSLSGHGVTAKVWTHESAKPSQWRAALARDVLASILATDGVPVRVDSSLGKDELPARWVQGTDRWESVLNLLQAVSGLLREDPFGAVLKAQHGPIRQPVLTLTDGDGGTVVHVPSGFDRRDRINHVVVRGTDFVSGKDFAVEAVEREGPYRPALYGWVTEVVDGDEISRLAQGQLVATNTLALARQYREVVSVETVTDWRVELDDPVEIQADGLTMWGRVVGIEMDLSGMGTMMIEVGVE